MGYKSREQFPDIPPSNEIIVQRINSYVARGLTQKEAADLVQIELIEEKNNIYVQLSDAEKRRKQEYLKKLDEVKK
jgi:hypothetical protein